jgi:hypothetical protein
MSRLPMRGARSSVAAFYLLSARFCFQRAFDLAGAVAPPPLFALLLWGGGPLWRRRDGMMRVYMRPMEREDSRASAVSVRVGFAFVHAAGAGWRRRRAEASLFRSDAPSPVFLLFLLFLLLPHLKRAACTG